MILPLPRVLTQISKEEEARIEGKDEAAASLGLNPSTLKARIH